MAVYFSLPDADTLELLARATKDYHPELAEWGVKIQVIMATSDTDAPAVRHGGYPAIATIRVVPLKDRLTKGYDAEMMISRDDFVLFREQHKLALLDHELCHLELVRKKPRKNKDGSIDAGETDGEGRGRPKLDDLGRPKLKLRKGDWNPGDGFKEVVARHGDDADEFAALTRAYAVASAAKGEGF